MEISRREKMEQIENILDKDVKEISREIDEKYGIYEEEENFTEENRPRKIKKQNIKYRKFKRKNLNPIGIAVVVLATGTIILVHTFKPYLSPKEKTLLQIVEEAEIHGGCKGYYDDEYLHDFNAHIESGECLIQGNGTVEERLEKLCKKEDFSDSVIDSVITKFQLNYNNEFKKASKIDPLKIFQEEQEQLKKEDDTSYSIYK